MCSVCVCVGASPLSIFVLVINPYPYVLHRSLAFDLDGFDEARDNFDLRIVAGPKL